MGTRHVLLVTFPAQGHINPALQFAKRLIRLGIEVTFVTSLYARRRMEKTAAAAGYGTLLKGLNFAPFSDGYDDGFKHGVDDPKKYVAEIQSQGSKALRDTVVAAAEDGHPITCVVHTLILPWASRVARELHLPNALLWIQPATVLDVYHHYFHGFKDEIVAISQDPSWTVQMPGAPPLSKRDLPSFLVPTTSEKTALEESMPFLLMIFKEQIDTLNDEERPRVLVNTFDALEADALAAIDKYEQIGIGPLIPSAFLDGQDLSDKTFGGDLFENLDSDYMEWLNSKAKSSVVYVSFGSLLQLPKAQKEEIGKGLMNSGRPFLWVMRPNEEPNEEDGELSCLPELQKIGKIVPWCSQLEVLTHRSVGCFISHCGWNSTLESISCGVPMVAFPQWTDQGTNAKMIEDVWRNGVRVRVDDDGNVGSDEITECIKKVMDGGDLSKELRQNAEKWKRLAKEAMEENGSSNRNLKAFFQQIGVNGV